MKKILIIFVGIFLAAVLISGCQQAKKPVPKTNTQTVPQTNETDMRIMASKFSTIAEKIDGVSKATVVVGNVDAVMSGTTTTSAVTKSTSTTPSTVNTGVKTVSTSKLVVMVGLKLDSKAMTDKVKENNIKNAVSKAIMNSDKRVTDVLVTTNPDMVKKINDVAAGIIEGKPVQSNARDVKELNRMLQGTIK